jgi:hypothetical protein
MFLLDVRTVDTVWQFLDVRTVDTVWQFLVVSTASYLSKYYFVVLHLSRKMRGNHVN